MSLDLICMGRAAVDLYGEQIGARLEDQSSFARYLGGCPANIAVGSARLGLRVAMLTRVGDEHNGRFVRETLAAEGVDVSHVATDPRKLTALVFLAIKDRASFPLLFYRHDCADMAVGAGDFEEGFLRSAKALLISGTHFSQPATARACFAAIAHAHKFVFDIDYRPVLWGLTGIDRGEDRFVASRRVTEAMQEVIRLAHVVIGTEEEFHIAGGCEDADEALRRLRQISPAVFVVKRGPLGCTVHDGTKAMENRGFPVEVFNILGAGDGFAAGFLSGWLRGAPLADCARRANACGALVVSRHGCAPAMPSGAELELFLSRADWPFRLRESRELEHVHRRTTGRKQWPEVLALAFDHRRQLEELGPPDRIRGFKRLVAKALHEAPNPSKGAILDDRYGEEALFALTGTGMWLARPVEVPGSRPLAFEAGSHLAARLRSWPAEHVVKCLTLEPRGDLPRLLELQEACIATGHELLVEIVDPEPPLDELYSAGLRPDWWKLAPPSSREAWGAIETAVRKHDPHCRGVLLLGMEASAEALERAFALAAAQPICKGFAVGRSIFMDAARRWLAGHASDEQVVAEVRDRYRNLISLWNDARRACKESVSSASA
ncbi:MAG TPA: 5-dehydro-2-deoxygluconokinase [Burkholderiales bacterium]|nr:5-dehydro-2-deoxygluconokinase [Burkholderiales bacterium]